MTIETSLEHLYGLEIPTPFPVGPITVYLASSPHEPLTLVDTGPRTPETLDVLAALQQRGYRLGIVSNWSWNLRERVARVGLDGPFELIWASAYAGCNKPHPDIFFQALALMGPPDVSPDRVLYVGDSYEHDVVGARNAGLDVVLLDRNGKAGAPDCPVIGDLYGLLGLLE